MIDTAFDEHDRITQTPSGVRLMAVNPDGIEVNVTEGVMALYDLVIGSMDWGSGFLTVEEALPVAEIAELCGFAEWEAAQAYVREQQHNAEQDRFLRNRTTVPPLREEWVTREDGSKELVTLHGDDHDHVWSSVGKCMWPRCTARGADVPLDVQP